MRKMTVEFPDIEHAIMLRILSDERWRCLEKARNAKDEKDREFQSDYAQMIVRMIQKIKDGTEKTPG